jgi:hypothetical protein
VRLDEALNPAIDPTTGWLYLAAAQEVLEETGDPRWDDTIVELQAVIQTMRQSATFEVRTPHPLPTIQLP